MKPLIEYPAPYSFNYNQWLRCRLDLFQCQCVTGQKPRLRRALKWAFEMLTSMDELSEINHYL